MNMITNSFNIIIIIIIIIKMGKKRCIIKSAKLSSSASYRDYIQTKTSPSNIPSERNTSNYIFRDVPPQMNLPMTTQRKKELVRHVIQLPKIDQWRIYCKIEETHGSHVLNVKQNETYIVLNNLEPNLLWWIDWYIQQSIDVKTKQETKTQFETNHKQAIESAVQDTETEDNISREGQTS